MGEERRRGSSNYPFALLILTVLVAAFQILILGRFVVEALLLSFLVVYKGLGGVWVFLGHFFSSDRVAEFIGWPRGNPFQKEVAFTNLSIGLLGLLCFWFRGDFWTATAVGSSIFSFGAAYVHIHDMHENKNYAPGNTGPVLYVSDILVPTAILILLVVYSLGY